MITLKLLEENDLEYIRLLRNANRSSFFHDAFITKPQQMEWYLQFKGIFFIIMHKRTRLGTISIKSLSDNYYELGNIIIEKKYRQKGILKKVIDLLKRDYAGRFFIQVKGDNQTALEAYTKIGFTIKSLTMEL